MGRIVASEEAIVNGTGDMRDILVLWVCPPEGCGRLYMEGSGFEIEGTWYQPESNERRSIL